MGNTERGDEAFDAVVCEIASDPEPECRLEDALRLLIRYGQIDGAHHKTWTIDQAVRALARHRYDALIAAANAGEDGSETYSWDTGTAP